MKKQYTMPDMTIWCWGITEPICGQGGVQYRKLGNGIEDMPGKGSQVAAGSPS